jgi:cytochrome oxidase assembly protein ShyY1
MVIDEEGAYCCVEDMRAYKEALTNTALLYATATSRLGSWFLRRLKWQIALSLAGEF